MSPANSAPDETADESLKRLGGGRWQTRDERFTIEPQSGTWVVVDAEQTDDLGLPLVRGPFPSLTAAKAAIGSARSTEPATSPLAGRLAKGRSSPTKAPPNDDRRRPRPTLVPDAPPEPDRSNREKATESARQRRTTEPEPPAEPSWLADLGAADRGRARRLIATLSDAGIADAEGIVRRDLAGGVPALAAVAIARRLEAL